MNILNITLGQGGPLGIQQAVYKAISLMTFDIFIAIFNIFEYIHSHTCDDIKYCQKPSIRIFKLN